MAAHRSLAAAVIAGWLAVAAPGAVAAQDAPVDETTTTTVPTTTTTAAPTTTTTTTEPPTTTTTTATTVPPDEPVPTTAPPGPAPATTAPAPAPVAAPTRPTAQPPPPPPLGAPPAVGGDAAAPAGPPPAIPPALQAKINSVRRTGSNSTVRLLEALAPLRAMGMTEQEAIQAGFGRFPVGGRATFSDDWWFPRFVPSIHLHEGTDIFAPYGTPARAPADGVLRQSFNPVGGLAAYVHELDGTYYYLAHLSRYEAGQVSGQRVKTGDVIGYVGDSGNARGTSPHVHFEVHPRGGGPVNPKPRLDAWLKEALAAVPRVVAEAAPRLADRAPATVAPEEQDLVPIGHSDLGGGGGNGEVAVVGATALVARGFAPPGAEVEAQSCQGSVSVVDISNPASPAVAATIALERGQRVDDVDGLAVSAPAFSGDLAAVAVAPCDGGGAGGLAYYDVTDRRRPQLLARHPHPPELDGPTSAAQVCGQQLRGTCPRTGRSVELRHGADGTVVSLSSSAAAGGTSPYEVYAVDVSEPREPVALGLFAGGPRRPQAPAADDGCSPLPLTPSDDAGDALAGMVDVGRFRWGAEAGYPRAARGDGPDGYPAVVEAGGRLLALAGDDRWWSSTWAVRVDPPSPLAGDKLGCPGSLSGASTAPGTAAGPTAGAMAYVGRGCPERRADDGAVVPADPYLADPAGRVAVADAGLRPVQAGLSPVGCTGAARLDRARQAGALGLVVAGSFRAEERASAPEARRAPGAAGKDDDGAIPALQLKKPDGDALRDALCPPGGGDSACGAGEAVSASLVELPGQWGGLRVVDVTDPEAPRQIEVYRTADAAAATPADPGSSHAVHAVVADGSRAYVAWGSEGLRVVDLASGSPVEAGSFLPPQGGAPPGAEPARPLATGVDHTADHIVVSDLASGLWVLDKRPPAGTRGYWLADADGGVYAFGDAAFAGSAAGAGLPAPVVAMDPSPSGRGYRLATSEGGVYAFGDALFVGSLAHAARSAPVVGMASTPTGGGYWLVSKDGGVFAFGDAPFLGSLAAEPPSRPIVDVVGTPTGRGYWLVGEDGGVFAFGDAAFLGSTADSPPPSRIVGAAATAGGQGYWLAAEDGGVFAFGDARFKGSMAGQPLPFPAAGIARMEGVKGYWMAGAGGELYALGAPFLGSRPSGAGRARVVAVAAVPRRVDGGGPSVPG